jgi:four helix bundle suffix protein
MVQAARSGVQNIAEGSVASGTSKKTELKLTNVARASLEELRLDYEDFLRQGGLAIWDRYDVRRARLIARRPADADAVAAWAREVKARGRQDRRDGRTDHRDLMDSVDVVDTTASSTTYASYPEIAANGALALIAVASTLPGRQISTLEKAFAEEGGFTERLYRFRTAARNSTSRKRR